MDLLDSYIKKLNKLGVKLMITELDVGVLPFYPVDSTVVPLSSFDAETQKKYNPYPDKLPEAVEKNLANRYAELFSYFKKHQDLFGRITFWAVHDGQTWRNYWPITGRADHPMLFDRNCQPKSALDAVAKVGQQE
jgi:endo-1,4-beta-xylanase